MVERIIVSLVSMPKAASRESRPGAEHSDHEKGAQVEKVSLGPGPQLVTESYQAVPILRRCTVHTGKEHLDGEEGRRDPGEYADRDHQPTDELQDGHYPGDQRGRRQPQRVDARSEIGDASLELLQTVVADDGPCDEPYQEEYRGISGVETGERCLHAHNFY